MSNSTYPTITRVTMANSRAAARHFAPSSGSAGVRRDSPTAVALRTSRRIMGVTETSDPTKRTTMRLGYNTNGFAHHPLSDTAAILQETGYSSVALTLERAHLDPPDRTGVARCIARLRPIFQRIPLCVTIETGARFLLDPKRKHQPTLVSGSPEDRETRIEFLRAAIDIGVALSAESVSLWSGSPDDDATESELWTRLTTGLRALVAYAEDRGMRLAFEPEPGMFIDTMAGFERLQTAINHPRFGLTLDVGHIHCLCDGDLFDHARRWRDRLWNVHIEDMRRGVHEHLMFGDGEMDFRAVIGALRAVDYAGPLHVELPRHSHDAVGTARRALAILTPYLPE